MVVPGGWSGNLIRKQTRRPQSGRSTFFLFRHIRDGIGATYTSSSARVLNAAANVLTVPLSYVTFTRSRFSESPKGCGLSITSHDDISCTLRRVPAIDPMMSRSI